MTTERAHSLKWFGLKKKILLKLKPVLCPFVTHSVAQLVDNSSSKTKGTINLSTGPGANALGQKPLPIFAVSTEALNHVLGVLGPQKKLLHHFSLAQGFDLFYAGREQEACFFKGNLSFQFNPVFLGMPGS